MTYTLSHKMQNLLKEIAFYGQVFKCDLKSPARRDACLDHLTRKGLVCVKPSPVKKHDFYSLTNKGYAELEKYTKYDLETFIKKELLTCTGLNDLKRACTNQFGYKIDISRTLNGMLQRNEIEEVRTSYFQVKNP